MREDKIFDSCKDSNEDITLMDQLNFYCDQVKNRVDCRSVQEVQQLMGTIND